MFTGMTYRFGLLLCALSLSANGADLIRPLVFTETCDAPAAVAANDDLFIVASDEDNILRCYRLTQPGKPVETFNLNSIPFAKKKSPEMDIEAAARLDLHIFWITSHGRKANGEDAPNRRLLFALELTETSGKVTLKPAGSVHKDLIADLSADLRFARFRPAEAAAHAPKSPDALNIEALSGTPSGHLLIGFRNPIPEGKALLVPLLNPNEVIAGQSPRFGDPILMDLGGLGLRGMGSTAAGF